MSYRDQLQSLGRIPSIEHFFNYYVFLKKPTDMPRDIDLFFFRNNEMPMWEVSIFLKLNPLLRTHQMAASGSSKSLKMTILTKCGSQCSSLSLVSLKTIWNLLGEQFEEPVVIGAGLSLRKKEFLM